MTSGCKGHVLFLDSYSNNHKAKLQLILFFAWMTNTSMNHKHHVTMLRKILNLKTRNSSQYFQPYDLVSDEDGDVEGGVRTNSLAMCLMCSEIRLTPETIFLRPTVIWRILSKINQSITSPTNRWTVLGLWNFHATEEVSGKDESDLHETFLLVLSHTPDDFPAITEQRSIVSTFFVVLESKYLIRSCSFCLTFILYSWE